MSQSENDLTQIFVSTPKSVTYKGLRLATEMAEPVFSQLIYRKEVLNKVIEVFIRRFLHCGKCCSHVRHRDRSTYPLFTATDAEKKIAGILLLKETMFKSCYRRSCLLWSTDSKLTLRTKILLFKNISFYKK